MGKTGDSNSKRMWSSHISIRQNGIYGKKNKWEIRNRLYNNKTNHPPATMTVHTLSNVASNYIKGKTDHFIHTVGDNFTFF